MSINRWMSQQNVADPYDGRLFNHKKDWSTDTWYNMNESRKQGKGKKPDPKDHILCDSTYEMSRIGKSGEIESRLVVS